MILNLADVFVVLLSATSVPEKRPAVVIIDRGIGDLIVEGRGGGLTEPTVRV